MEIEVPVDDRDVCPDIFRYHFVPEGRLDSVKVTSYVTSVNVTDIEEGEAPFMVSDPV